MAAGRFVGEFLVASCEKIGVEVGSCFPIYFFSHSSLREYIVVVGTPWPHRGCKLVSFVQGLVLSSPSCQSKLSPWDIEAVVWLALTVITLLKEYEVVCSDVVVRNKYNILRTLLELEMLFLSFLAYFRIKWINNRCKNGSFLRFTIYVIILLS